MPNRQTRVHFALLAFLLFPLFNQAQSTFGDIRGTLRTRRPLIPQATVTLHSLDENTDRVSTSDATGGYLFENLKPGHYTVSAMNSGFSASSAVSLELTARQSARVTSRCRLRATSRP